MDKWCWFKVGEIENVIVRTMFAPIYIALLRLVGIDKY